MSNHIFHIWSIVVPALAGTLFLLAALSGAVMCLFVAGTLYFFTWANVIEYRDALRAMRKNV